MFNPTAKHPREFSKGFRAAVCRQVRGLQVLSGAALLHTGQMGLPAPPSWIHRDLNKLVKDQFRHTTLETLDW